MTENSAGSPRTSSSTGRPPRKRRRRRRPADKTTAAPKGALKESRLDATRPADEPLTAEEVAEMRQHLRFLFENRKLLRLRVNAQEDLLLNGAREPEHRGACLHLLRKVDLACVEGTLTRLEEPAEKAALLSGVVRFSTDVGILLLYLENLAGVTSRRAAAGAFSIAVKRIDFEKVSESRMRRVLELVATIFDGHERVQVLFGLLSSESFQKSFDASTGALSGDLAEVLVPLRAVHEAIFEGRPESVKTEDISKGVSVLLSAPDDVLKAYPMPVRERLLESAVRLVDDAAVADRAERTLLGSLSPKERSFSRLGMLRASELLRHGGADDEARQILEKIREAHQGFHMPARWLNALDAPRVGRVALVGSPGRSAERPRKGRRRKGGPKDAQARPSTESSPRAVERFQEGFRLDVQRPVWVRVGTPDEVDGLAEQAEVLNERSMPGLLPLSCCGVSEDGAPYVAVPAFGQPLMKFLARRRWLQDHGVSLALQGVQLLSGLQLMGLELPDLAPERFVVQDGAPPALWLADAARLRTSKQGVDMRPLATAWCSLALSELEEGEGTRRLREAVLGDADLPSRVASLAAEA